MIHPHTEIRFISPEKGYGVVATQRIPKGTITWVQDKLDRTFTPEDVEALEDIYKDILETYTFRNNQGNFILCWDHARFVNHSFQSNCLTTAYDFEIAIRDIEEGEELTDDYGYLNISEPFRALDEKTRRKIVYPDDLRKYYKIWDKKLIEAFKFLPKVPQLLMELLPADLQKEVVEVAEGKQEMESILTCYYENGYARKHGKQSS